MKPPHFRLSSGNTRRGFLSQAVTAALGVGGGSAARAADVPASKSKFESIPSVTVKELAQGIREEGFQWKFLARQLVFTGTVVEASPMIRIRIDGMDDGKLDHAALHQPGTRMELKAGERLEVRGLLVDQWYGVWQVWCYQVSRVG